MTRTKFDRYMVAVGAARHVKFRRLTVPERHAFFLGVLSLAAQSQIRGALLIGNLRVEAEDVAAEADVPVRVARDAMRKLRAVGVLVEDREHDCEVVHDFDDYNPAPKTDRTAAERQQRRRDRVREGRDVTAASRRDVTPPSRPRHAHEGEGEGEEQTLGATPTHPGGLVVDLPGREIA
jgi:hypothetical protein